MPDIYELLLSFDSDHPEFVRGFEVGRMWASLPGERQFTVHASNAEMVVRISEAMGMRARSEDLGDSFIGVTFDEA
jgi:hypothetical protein